MNRDRTGELRQRLDRMRGMPTAERDSLLATLQRDLPREHLPWPFGMPTSVAPHVVVIGVSPGNSPAASGQPTSSTGVGTYDPPTFGEPHRGFFYPDTKSYWEKVRALCIRVVRADAPGLTDEEALAVSGHFNLGTGLFGEASSGAIEPGVIAWVSNLLNTAIPARVVICLGLGGILAGPSVNRSWNSGENSLRVDWSRPAASHDFVGFRYKFRTWSPIAADGRRILVCTWPNHPSRHPFAGPVGPNWVSSIDAFCLLLK